MRTNIDINDDLMNVAMAAGGFRTKKEAVEAGLKLVARQKAYRDILELKGTIEWTSPDEPWPHTVQEPRKSNGRKSIPKTRSK